MLSYTLAKPEKEDSVDPMMPSSEGVWERTISIPINQEIMDALSVDDQVVLVLDVKVTELRSNDTENEKYRHASFVISNIQVDDGMEGEENASFQRGFNRGPTRMY